MFERVAFKNSAGPGPLVDIGALAEALLFYGEVVVVCNTATLKYLLKKIPPLVLLELVSNKRLILYYLEDQVGVVTNEQPGQRPIHELVEISSPDHTIDVIGPKAFIEASNSSNKLNARKFARQLLPISHAGFAKAAVLDAIATSTLSEPALLELMNVAAPEYKLPADFRFRLERQATGFVIDTNIDFAKLNSAYHLRVSPKHSSMTPAYLVALLQGVYEEIYIAGTLESELALSGSNRAMHVGTINAFIRSRIMSEDNIARFTDITLYSANAIREAVNSNQVTFADVARLLEKADRFREWIRGQPAQVDLLKSYYSAVVSQTWVERLPLRGTRWGIFTTAGLAIDAAGAGGLGTAAGIALGAFDTFVIDKLVGGWKPNHFVEKELKDVFVGRNEAK